MYLQQPLLSKGNNRIENIHSFLNAHGEVPLWQSAEMDDALPLAMYCFI